MRARRGLLLATLCLALPGHAGADAGDMAILSEVSGNVLVGEGATLHSAEAGEALAPGARVLVISPAAATVAFADGCLVRLGAGQRYEVPRASPCRTGGPRIEWIERRGSGAS